LTRGTDLVFPSWRGEGRMSGFPKVWARVARFGPLDRQVTPHVLRHSFASLAADLGLSEPTIAALIGHKGRSMTSRYLHSADAVLLSAADQVADRIVEMLGDFGSCAQTVSRASRMGSRQRRSDTREET
jgi:integrase